MQPRGEGLRDPRHVTQLLSLSPHLANKDDKGASSLSCFQGEMGLRVGSAAQGLVQSKCSVKTSLVMTGLSISWAGEWEKERINAIWANPLCLQ